MRLWSLHPRYFDKEGLLALWRNALLAQKALNGQAEKFAKHPQLERFKNCDNPVKAIGAYLSFIASEGLRRGFKMSHEKIICPNFDENVMAVNDGQLFFEMQHLRGKLCARHQSDIARNETPEIIDTNPAFGRGGRQSPEAQKNTLPTKINLIF